MYLHENCNDEGEEAELELKSGFDVLVGEGPKATLGEGLGAETELGEGAGCKFCGAAE